MARRPIEHEVVGLQTPRERVWRAIRKLRTFTMLQVQDATDPLVPVHACESYVTWLVTAGYLGVAEAHRTRSGNGKYTEQTYRLLKDSFEAPRVTRAGEPVSQGMANLAMWRAMKILREFDWEDVCRAASTQTFQVAPTTASTYVRFLARAGYFRELRKPKPGTPGRYRLVRDTGAHAPAITRRKTVFDRNTGEFTWQQSPQEVCDGIE
ncbi:hypothetical protein [Variovorax atrisoli]|uniref:hypothetical protein n=1 Tax=Variovorax atrisoli TaxID=3394203 RepID=UPI003398AAA6